MQNINPIIQSAVDLGATLHVDFKTESEDEAVSLIVMYASFLGREYVEVIKSNYRYFSVVPVEGDTISINVFVGKAVYRPW